MKVGTKCRVIRDSLGSFEPGEIIVVLEESNVPYCVRLDEYSPGKKLGEYDDFNPLCLNELDPIEEDIGVDSITVSATDSNIGCTQLSTVISDIVSNDDLDNLNKDISNKISWLARVYKRRAWRDKKRR